MSYPSEATTAKVDLYEQVTNSIIRAIEEGAGKYVMPWHSLANPINAVSRKSYRGINTLLLWGAAHQAQYKSNEWATYNGENDSDENTPNGLMFFNSAFVINGLRWTIGRAE